MSKLYFRYGAMNSGKTTLLLQVAHNYKERGKETLVIKPNIDTKGQDKIVSRLGIEKQVDILLSKEDNIIWRISHIKDAPAESILAKWEQFANVKCILVDEAQFLTKDQVDQLFYITKSLDIPVICYGLRTDFKTQGFEGSTRLLEMADSIEEMKTICRCGNKATLNGRKINGEFVFDGEQIEIDDGSKVEYESLCGKCYIKERGKIWK